VIEKTGKGGERETGRLKYKETKGLILKNMAKKEFSFNNAVQEIENILQNIESGDLDIDKLSVEVKRASELIKECQKKLRSTEEESIVFLRTLYKSKSGPNS